jgi:hypothetical protein
MIKVPAYLLPIEIPLKLTNPSSNSTINRSIRRHDRGPSIIVLNEIPLSLSYTTYHSLMLHNISSLQRLISQIKTGELIRLQQHLVDATGARPSRAVANHLRNRVPPINWFPTSLPPESKSKENRRLNNPIPSSMSPPNSNHIPEMILIHLQQINIDLCGRSITPDFPKSHRNHLPP